MPRDFQSGWNTENKPSWFPAMTTLYLCCNSAISSKIAYTEPAFVLRVKSPAMISMSASSDHFRSESFTSPCVYGYTINFHLLPLVASINTENNMHKPIPITTKCIGRSVIFSLCFVRRICSTRSFVFWKVPLALPFWIYQSNHFVVLRACFLVFAFEASGHYNFISPIISWYWELVYAAKFTYKVGC